ncbi:MAG: aldo/keto reductase [Bacteroidetes bacterium]|nr:aldo/keto reductase [Bacteroidota bacterium]
MALEIRKIGSQGLEASSLGLGCMGMSEFYGPADDKESIRIIHEAIDRGVNFLDTADVYGPHKNEVLVGKAVADRRVKVVIATKFGIVRDPSRPNDRGVNGRPEYVRSCCENSLKRLGVESIDLYYQHRVDPSIPIEETVGAMADLVRQGKVRFIGLSEAGPETIKRAHAVHPVTALQTEYSLWTRDPEKELIQTCRALGIGVVPYSPLGRGFLTGTIGGADALGEDDWRRSNPRFLPENFNGNLALVERIRQVATTKNCTPAQLALAWVMSQGNDMFPIPGTKKMKYLIENIQASDIQLAASDFENLSSLEKPLGERYTDAGMKGVGL